HEIGQLTDIEKILLYLQLPTGTPHECDPLKQKGPGNPFGKKADVEVAQTYTWIQSHLEEDPSTSLPKHEVYEEYRGFCTANKFEPLCVADFGKAMKHIFPRVKPRRLGQRGNSKYCYSGLRKKLTVEAPILPELETSGKPSEEEKTECNGNELHDTGTFSDDTITAATNHIILEWAEKLFSQQFKTMKDLGRYLIDYDYVDSNSVAAVTMISSFDEKQNKLLLKKGVNRGCKRDAQIHLQKKLYQKELINEQKKKLELSKAPTFTKTVPVSLTKNSSKKIKKTTVSSKSLESPKCLLKMTQEKEVKIKAEKADDQYADNHETIAHQQRIQNKIPIPRTGAPQVSSNHLSASFIVLPGIPTHGVTLASTVSKSANENSNSTQKTVIQTSPIKSASKYKRIQPKPVNVNRSNSAIESIITSSASNSSLDSNDNFDSSIKRRHSVSVPIATDTKHVQFDITQNDKQVKRHIEEKDINARVSKKRFVENSKIISSLPSSNNSEEAASSASLSPVSQPDLIVPKANCGDERQSGLVVQDLEQDCLLEYFHDNTAAVVDSWDSSSKTAQLSQLRKLLEKNLPPTPSKIGEQKQQLIGFSELKQAISKKPLNNNYVQSVNQYSENVDSFETQTSNNFSTSSNSSALNSPLLDSYLCTNSVNRSSQRDVNSLPSVNTVSSTLSNVISTNVQTQFPSVPPSPNTRRRAFSFQPISPRNTPTIPENSSLSSSAYGSIGSSSSDHSPPQYNANQQSVGVGPSQSPSAANSPFVSPRTTPIPLSRSRHNSGQSTYSASRQTPFQNFDSGVSSISNSPFISPQSTPVPLSRVRVGSTSMQRTLRARHSSGPGNPYMSLHHSYPNAVGPRSCSLSPMVCATNLDAITGNGQFPFVLIQAEKNVNIQTHGSDNNANLPISPGSDQMSPNPTIIKTETQSSENIQNKNENQFVGHFLAATQERQRHMSSPYTMSPSTPMNNGGDSQEIQNLLKNVVLQDINQNSDSANKTLLNRSHSVPVHQMKQVYYFRCNSDSPPNPKNSNDSSESIFASKSYPATPICNQSFQFPPSPPLSAKMQNALGSDDLSSGFLQSGHDVMVSGLQPSWNSGAIASNEIGAENELITASNPLMNASEARRNMNDDLLNAPPPMEDELQTALEDLRDCDSEFSKFAQELEAMEANEANSNEDMS
ncbi:uncharacterized protein B4U79_13987, partial [Dinothrombium tinctorium]